MKKQIFYYYEFGITFDRFYELDAIKGSTTFVMESIGISWLLIVGNTGCVLVKLEWIDIIWFLFYFFSKINPSIVSSIESWGLVLGPNLVIGKKCEKIKFVNCKWNRWVCVYCISEHNLPYNISHLWHLTFGFFERRRILGFHDILLTLFKLLIIISTHNLTKYLWMTIWPDWSDIQKWYHFW